MPGASPPLSIVAAIARNRVIGSKGELPWRLSADLKRFRRITLGHPVIMGRKTYESIVRSLGRPLPERHNIVITRSAGFLAPGCSTANSLQSAISTAAQITADEAFIIGGAEIYRLALPKAVRMHLTEIDADFEGDAFFPSFDPAQWRETVREPGPAEKGLSYSFVTYERRTATSAG
jgi:dihydrofolate reductase